MKEVKERPILFSGPMVRAILEGRKTQTRRVVKASGEALRYSKGHGMDATPRPATGRLIYRDGGAWDDSELRTKPISICPYGKPGDRLWVRESFQPLYLDKYAGGHEPDDIDYETGKGYQINYVATDGVKEFCDMSKDEAISDRVTPSIFMPRWASRITLEITDVRVQRLQDISEEDAMAEGIPHGDCLASHRDNADRFAALWNSINVKKHPWSSNPWVWAVSFKRVEASS